MKTWDEVMLELNNILAVPLDEPALEDAMGYLADSIRAYWSSNEPTIPETDRDESEKSGE